MSDKRVKERITAGKQASNKSSASVSDLNKDKDVFSNVFYKESTDNNKGLGAFAYEAGKDSVSSEDNRTINTGNNIFGKVSFKDLLSDMHSEDLLYEASKIEDHVLKQEFDKDLKEKFNFADAAGNFTFTRLCEAGASEFGKLSVSELREMLDKDRDQCFDEQLIIKLSRMLEFYDDKALSGDGHSYDKVSTMIANSVGRDKFEIPPDIVLMGREVLYYEAEILRLVNGLHINVHSQRYQEQIFFYYLLAQKTGSYKYRDMVRRLVDIQCRLTLLGILSGGFIYDSDFDLCNDVSAKHVCHYVPSRDGIDSLMKEKEEDPDFSCISPLHFMWMGEACRYMIIEHMPEVRRFMRFILSLSEKAVAEHKNAFFPSCNIPVKFIPVLYSYLLGQIALFLAEDNQISILAHSKDPGTAGMMYSELCMCLGGDDSLAGRWSDYFASERNNLAAGNKVSHIAFEYALHMRLLSAVTDMEQSGYLKPFTDALNVSSEDINVSCVSEMLKQMVADHCLSYVNDRRRSVLFSCLTSKETLALLPQCPYLLLGRSGLLLFNKRIVALIKERTGQDLSALIPAESEDDRIFIGDEEIEEEIAYLRKRKYEPYVRTSPDSLFLIKDLLSGRFNVSNIEYDKELSKFFNYLDKGYEQEYVAHSGNYFLINRCVPDEKAFTEAAKAAGCDCTNLSKVLTDIVKNKKLCAELISLLEKDLVLMFRHRASKSDVISPKDMLFYADRDFAPLVLGTSAHTAYLYGRAGMFNDISDCRSHELMRRKASAYVIYADFSCHAEAADLVSLCFKPVFSAVKTDFGRESKHRSLRAALASVLSAAGNDCLSVNAPVFSSYQYIRNGYVNTGEMLIDDEEYVSDTERRMEIQKDTVIPACIYSSKSFIKVCGRYIPVFAAAVAQAEEDGYISLPGFRGEVKPKGELYILIKAVDDILIKYGEASVRININSEKRIPKTEEELAEARRTVDGLAILSEVKRTAVAGAFLTDRVPSGPFSRKLKLLFISGYRAMETEREANMLRYAAAVAGTPLSDLLFTLNPALCAPLYDEIGGDFSTPVFGIHLANALQASLDQVRPQDMKRGNVDRGIFETARLLLKLMCHDRVPAGCLALFRFFAHCLNAENREGLCPEIFGDRRPVMAAAYRQLFTVALPSSDESFYAEIKNCFNTADFMVFFLQAGMLSESYTEAGCDILNTVMAEQGREFVLRYLGCIEPLIRKAAFFGNAYAASFLSEGALSAGRSEEGEAFAAFSCLAGGSTSYGVLSKSRLLKIHGFERLFAEYMCRLNNPYGYTELYRCLKDSDTEKALAHTALYYAYALGVPEAGAEYRKLVSDGTFTPLPYLACFLSLMQSAEHNPAALYAVITMGREGRPVPVKFSELLRLSELYGSKLGGLLFKDILFDRELISDERYAYISGNGFGVFPSEIGSVRSRAETVFGTDGGRMLSSELKSDDLSVPEPERPAIVSEDPESSFLINKMFEYLKEGSDFLSIRAAEALMKSKLLSLNDLNELRDKGNAIHDASGNLIASYSEHAAYVVDSMFLFLLMSDHSGTELDFTELINREYAEQALSANPDVNAYIFAASLCIKNPYQRPDLRAFRKLCRRIAACGNKNASGQLCRYYGYIDRAPYGRAFNNVKALSFEKKFTEYFTAKKSLHFDSFISECCAGIRSVVDERKEFEPIYAVRRNLSAKQRSDADFALYCMLHAPRGFSSLVMCAGNPFLALKRPNETDRSYTSALAELSLTSGLRRDYDMLRCYMYSHYFKACPDADSFLRDAYRQDPGSLFVNNVLKINPDSEVDSRLLQSMFREGLINSVPDAYFDSGFVEGTYKFTGVDHHDGMFDHESGYVFAHCGCLEEDEFDLSAEGAQEAKESLVRIAAETDRITLSGTDQNELKQQYGILRKTGGLDCLLPDNGRELKFNLQYSVERFPGTGLAEPQYSYKLQIGSEILSESLREITGASDSMLERMARVKSTDDLKESYGGGKDVEAVLRKVAAVYRLAKTESQSRQGSGVYLESESEGNIKSKVFDTSVSEIPEVITAYCAQEERDKALLGLNTNNKEQAVMLSEQDRELYADLKAFLTDNVKSLQTGGTKDREQRRNDNETGLLKTERQYMRPWLYYERENPMMTFIYGYMMQINSFYTDREDCRSALKIALIQNLLHCRLDSLYGLGYFFGCNDVADMGCATVLNEMWHIRLGKKESLFEESGSLMSAKYLYTGPDLLMLCMTGFEELSADYRMIPPIFNFGRPGRITALLHAGRLDVLRRLPALSTGLCAHKVMTDFLSRNSLQNCIRKNGINHRLRFTSSCVKHLKKYQKLLKKERPFDLPSPGEPLSLMLSPEYRHRSCYDERGFFPIGDESTVMYRSVEDVKRLTGWDPLSETEPDRKIYGLHTDECLRDSYFFDFGLHELLEVSGNCPAPRSSYALDMQDDVAES